ncbi:molecular chaperone [Vibrio sp. WJH972]
MYIGFDYGTSNCSVATMKDNTPIFLPLENDQFYIPSTVCAPTRASISEHLFRHLDISPIGEVGERVLRTALAFNRDEDIDLEPNDIMFGRAALAAYLDDPSNVYYVKSPKSFLGASGLLDTQISFFEDLVCLMMTNIKRKAEQTTNTQIADTVIGRPINFHGRGGDVANQQAETILYQAAKRAGFNNIEFQFEPVAAGLEYEATLNSNQIVLVVDIGGGTTDCSVIEMGPSLRGKADRSQSLLAHSGLRVGGNDLDIALAFDQLMQPFGKNSQFLSGLEMPLTQFRNPIAINNVAAQSDFYSRQNLAELTRLHKDAQHPNKLARLLEVYNEKLGYRIVRRAEEAKIALSNQDAYLTKLELLEETLQIDIEHQKMVDAIESPKNKMIELAKDAVTQAGVTPDTIFVTGGSSRSPVLRHAIEQAFPNIPIVTGNHYGSVTAGLARWAEICFK